MAQTPEAKVKAKVRKILADAGVYYFSPAANGYGRAGIPDIVGCVNGMFFAIECKANGNTTTALQFRELEGIRAAGGIALVVDEHNTEMVATFIHSLRDRK